MARVRDGHYVFRQKCCSGITVKNNRNFNGKKATLLKIPVKKTVKNWQHGCQQVTVKLTVFYC